MKPRSKTKMITASLFLLYALSSDAADNVVGIWSDKDSQNIYDFIAGGEFEYFMQQTPKKDKSVTSSTEKEVRYRTEKGVWQQGKDICWVPTQKGNLMVYVGNNQCCFMEQIIAGKLVLSEVFKKGDEETTICSNRVLNRIERLPHEKNGRVDSPGTR